MVKINQPKSLSKSTSIRNSIQSKKGEKPFLGRLLAETVSAFGAPMKLWHEPREGLIGSIGAGRNAHWLAPEKVRNAFNPHEDGRALLNRLGGPTGLPSEWFIVFRDGKFYIGPPLFGSAGPDAIRHLLYPNDYERAKISYVSKSGARNGLKRYSGFDGSGYEADHAVLACLEAYCKDKFGFNCNAPELLAWVTPEAHRGRGGFTREHLVNLKYFLFNMQPNPEQLFKFLAQQAKYFDYQIGSYPGQYDLGSLITQRSGVMAENSRIQTFSEQLGCTGLHESYNGVNPEHPIILPGSMAGEIGGVGLTTGTIEGLKNSLFDLLEDEHTFLLPADGDRPPFSDGELRQLLREMATNIFFYGKRPMFSLHFNQDGRMYPVIPPEYANTLVGRVMGMLDYMMKGFLNGGVFTEDFVNDWARKGHSGATPSASCLVDLHAYCRDHLGDDFRYHGLQEVMAAFAVPGPEADKLRYRSSFRIIADNPIRQSGATFQIGTDFRVEYTIEATPEFEGYLRRHRAEHGCDPDDFIRLNQAYAKMAEEIRIKMPKLPMCRDYFNMLGVIHFFSYYLATLKDMHKLVALTPEPVARTTQFPRLMPPLPLRRIQSESVSLRLSDLGERIGPDDRRTLMAVAKLLQAHPVDADGKLPPTVERALGESAPRRIFAATYACGRSQLQGEPLLNDANLAPLDLCQNVAVVFAQKIARERGAVAAEVRLSSTALADRQAALADLEKQKRMNAAELAENTLTAVREAREDFHARCAVAKAEAETQLAKEEVRLVNENSTLWWWGPNAQARLRIDQALADAKARVDADLALDEEHFEAQTRAWEQARADGLAAEIARVDAGLATEYEKTAAAQTSLTALQKIAEDPLGAPIFVSQIQIQINMKTARLTQTDPDLPGEQASGRYRLVGGCGLHTPTTAAKPITNIEAIANQVAPILAQAPVETLREVKVGQRSYWCFKLPVFDYVTTKEQDSSWLQGALTSTTQGGLDHVGTHLALAVVQGDPAVVRRVLGEHPADAVRANLAHQDPQGFTLLHLAIQPGRAPLVRLLIEAGGDPPRGRRNGAHGPAPRGSGG